MEYVGLAFILGIAGLIIAVLIKRKSKPKLQVVPHKMEHAEVVVARLDSPSAKKKARKKKKSNKKR